MPVDPRADSVDAIAIVGIGGLFAGSESPTQFWSNIVARTDSTSEVPAGRWFVDPHQVFDRRVSVADHVCSTRGGFVKVPRFDPAGTGLDPAWLDRLDPVFHIALCAATRAWRDARVEAIDRARVGVIFGNIVLPTETAGALTREFVADELDSKLPLLAARDGMTDPSNAFPAGQPAAVVARALGLRGAAFTIDAACGSSLYALKLAVDELRSGRADAMLCGGVSRPDALYTQMGFSQLRALSPTGKATPLDHRGDGLVVGEGAGMFVLKRLADALRQEDRIYGIVAGIGLSNDVQGNLLAPDSEGQLRALHAAYTEAGWQPSDVDLIECHATGTPRGDAVEVASLKSLWGTDGWKKQQCVIGSIKGNIGHALTAAGAAGLLKVLLALKHSVLPPTANFERPASSLDLENSPFRVLSRPEPWAARTPGRPRRAAVSGFGFGGINAHVLIEEWCGRATGELAEQAGGADTRRARARGGLSPSLSPIAIVGISAQIGPNDGKDAFEALTVRGIGPDPATRPRTGPADPAAHGEARHGHTPQSFRGYFLDSLEFRPDRFRIPPKELAEMLPQQLLMLRVAADAIEDANWNPRLSSRTGVLIGIGLDLNTTNFHLRWWLTENARVWNQTLGPGLSTEMLADWIRTLRTAAGPELTANRTMGSLGGVIASRIAREFRIGGPSFTVSSDETSGVHALAIAVDWLRRGELDAVVVGAVDLAGDVRAVSARARLTSGSGADASPCSGGPDGMGATSLVCDAAVCMVLKRAEDARRANDRIYALVRGLGSSTGVIRSETATDHDPRQAAATLARADAGGSASSIGLLELQGSGGCPNLSHMPDARGKPGNSLRLACVSSSEMGYADRPIRCLEEDLGTSGAAAGLMAVARIALCVHRHVLPGSLGSLRTRFDASSASFAETDSCTASAWLRNRAEGPRRAAVSTASLGGNYAHVIVESEPDRDAASAEGSFGGVTRHGARAIAIFAVEAGDDLGLSERVQELRQLAGESSGAAIDVVARHWWHRHPNDSRLARGIAIVADSVQSLERVLAWVDQHSGRLPDGECVSLRGGWIHFGRDRGRATPMRLALVYPGLGNHFAGMGRDLASLWPEILERQDAENQYLRDQFDPAFWWSGQVPKRFVDHRVPILGQVSVGSLVTDILLHVGLKPHAAIGYSMGESAALVALRAWTNRDELLARLRASSLFTRDLAGPCLAARRLWGIPEHEPVDWVAGIIPRAAEDVRAAIPASGQVYVLSKNAADETVIGGNRRRVEELTRSLGSPLAELPTVSTVHCEIGRAVQREYLALHDLETIAPSGITFYSGISGNPYDVDRRSAANAIAAQATEPIDFPAVIERAYADGVGIFVEAGPGSSCTRLIGRILGRRPHVAVAACRAERNALAAILEVLGGCVASRLPVDLGRLYGGSNGQSLESTNPLVGRDSGPGANLRIPVSGWTVRIPAWPTSESRVGAVPVSSTPTEQHADPLANSHWPIGQAPMVVEPARASDCQPNGTEWFVHGTTSSRHSWATAVLHDSETAVTGAHHAFLRVSQGIAELVGKAIANQLELIESLSAGNSRTPSACRELASPVPARPAGRNDVPAAFLDRQGCLKFAVGSVAEVLGPEFAAVDRLPSRVRLPAEPLMLVDRILSIEGAPRSLGRGRVVTEHFIEPGAWYLESQRIPACIAMEAGQADLFLCSFLGVDLVTRGLAVYRLLDATVTFHRGLPGVGEVIRYDIRITTFFRQGTTILFRFEFDATVAGELLLSMRDGCAGFFTPEELARGKGLVLGNIENDAQREPSTKRDDEPIPTVPGRLNELQVEALRRGDLAAAFGIPFREPALEDPIALPGGPMSLIRRVAMIDPAGGPHGLGLIRAEADIEPADWFMTCHFQDDPVMPGTLMYECCLQSLRILMMRLGSIGERERVAFEPVPGTPNHLKCRGQIVPTTRTAVYEVTIRERGFRPEPYAIADALVIADGKPIVAVSALALQLTGTSREELERLWPGCSAKNAVPVYGADREPDAAPPAAC
jgi:acyl transferase domain-containing protein/3-hydroxymyristoyl/3-hydroxydecanoyl-(acyl carrier protein) dehydratase